MVNAPTQYRNPANARVTEARPWPTKSDCRGHAPRDVEHLEEPDDREERGVLEEADELAHDRRQDRAQGLREHDLAHRPHRAQPEGLRRLDLPSGHRLETAAHDLGDVGALEQRDDDERPHEEARRVDRGREGVDDQVLPDEEERHQGHPPEELDVADREHAQDRQPRSSAQRGEDADREGDDDPDHGDEEGELEPAPVIPPHPARRDDELHRHEHADGHDRPEPSGQAGQPAPDPRVATIVAARPMRRTPGRTVRMSDRMTATNSSSGQNRRSAAADTAEGIRRRRPPGSGDGGARSRRQRPR